MRFGVLLFAFMVSAVSVYAQDEEPRYQLNGRVYSPDSVTPLSQAYVIIKRSDGGAITDPQGRFTLYIKKSDTLAVSYTGMMTQTIPVTNLINKTNENAGTLQVKVYMKVLVIQLRSAHVVAIKTSDSKATDKIFYEGLIQRYTVNPSFGSAAGGGMAVNGGLSAIIAPFTHKGKEMIKFEQMYRRMEVERVVNKRFNEDLVHDITGLDYADIPAFKKYCGFTNEFVLASPDYDFVFAIKKAYERYMFAKFGIKEQTK
ncbi:MAG: carboxypeptidase-like regulatory domain-containing protein [Bacteroidia bacterium]|nr:carboxypeptidase-like regulatory domain-containing protein [Bacteroidia bacterium]